MHLLCSGRAFNTGLFGVRNRPAAIAILKRWAYDLRDPGHEEYDVRIVLACRRAACLHPSIETGGTPMRSCVLLTDSRH